METNRKLYHGVAFYPELWPLEELVSEIQKLKDCQINVVRMGEFAWAKMEPAKDEISLQFFVDVMDQLHANGIRTVFCTPTPTPPIWLTHDQPQHCHVDENGMTAIHGGRQHICQNHPYVRERARIIIEAIVKAIGNHPGLIGWQTDNEFGCDAKDNFSAATRQRWIQWLENKYGCIDKLNALWGTEIWSEKYQNFAQVPPPLRNMTLHNASLSHAYKAFCREMVVEFQKEHIEIIRRHSNRPITHNGGLDFNSDQFAVYADLDFAACDYYTDKSQYSEILLNHEFWRNVIPGKPFWVMETCSGHSGNLQRVSRTNPPGFVKVKAVSAYAMGAESFCYWVWRQQRSGCEMNHAGIYSSWGKPTVGHQYLMEVVHAKQDIETVITATQLKKPEVALLWSEQARVSFEVESIEGLNYHDLLSKWASLLRKAGVALDVIGEHVPLEGYRILYTPFCPFLDDAFIRKAHAFVEAGGIWLVGPMSGFRTAEHTVHTDMALGPLEALTGIETVYTLPLTGTDSEGECLGTRATLAFWGCLFEPDSGTSRGLIRGGPADGMSFLSECRIGKGQIVVLGAMPSGDAGQDMLLRIVSHYNEEADVSHKFEVTEGTLVVARTSTDAVYWFVINMDGTGGVVYLPQNGIDFHGQQSILKGALAIDPYEYRIIQFPLSRST